MDASPDGFFNGVVKVFGFLELEPRLNIKYEFNWAGKNEHFSKVSESIFRRVISLNSKKRQGAVLVQYIQSDGDQNAASDGFGISTQLSGSTDFFANL